MWCKKTCYSVCNGTLCVENTRVSVSGSWPLVWQFWHMSCSRGPDHSRRQRCRHHTRALSGGSSSLSSSLVSSVSKWCAIDNLKSRSFGRCFLRTSRSWQSSLYHNHEGVQSFRESGRESGAQGTSGRTDVNRAPCLQGGSLLACWCLVLGVVIAWWFWKCLNIVFKHYDLHLIHMYPPVRYSSESAGCSNVASSSSSDKSMSEASWLAIASKISSAVTLRDLEIDRQKTKFVICPSFIRTRTN